jgi:hypothetical protein
MNNTDCILAYEQNPQIYDYVFRDDNFYLNLEGIRQYHFPWIDLSKNKLTLFTGQLKSNSIIYVSMHDFNNLVQILKKDLNKKYILLVEGGDGSIEEIELPNNILHVYCPNLPFYNTRYSPYPRGILKGCFIKNTGYIKNKTLYCNFTVYDHSNHRINDFNYWQKRSYLESWITVKPANHADNKAYWKDLYEHYFNICSSPASDKDKDRDTYRFWETLVSGGYPIIKRSKMAEFFLYELDLPLIIVDSWDEINLDKLQNLIPILSKKDISPITEEYWINKLRKQFES